MLHALLHRVSPLIPGLAALLLALPAAGTAQAGRAVVRQAENLRAEPNGVVVAVLAEGTAMDVVRTTGRWVEVVLEGWVWSESLTTRGGAFELVVSEAGGENLRARPQGEVVARLEEGTLLNELDREPGWIRVRRQAWVWAPSVELSAGGEGGSASPAPAPASTAPNPAGSGVFRAGAGSPVLGSPDGDTLSLLRPGTELTVTGRQGNWARVRLDGWVWMPSGAPSGGGAGGEAPSDVTLASVLDRPDGFDGRIVSWELQFVSLERAEAVRTDFYEGEPFLLMRPVGQAGTRFVYVALPPERVAEAQGLTPLERMTVVGRIRTGASTLTQAPILDLVELRRGG